MAKRSDFERAPRDLYPTPYKAILPLLPHLTPATPFIEPCAGDGRLIGYLQEHGHVCHGAYDVEPGDPSIKRADALNMLTAYAYGAMTFITNPPWSREILHPLILHLSAQHPTWLLIDANWANTAQAARYLEHCRKIVVIGRVKWIENSPHQGKDDSAWFLFTSARSRASEFYGRLPA